MKRPLQSSEAFAPVLRAQGQAAQIMMMVATKTQETNLKRQALSRLPELIKRVQQEEQRMRLIAGLLE